MVDLLGDFRRNRVRGRTSALVAVGLASLLFAGVAYAAAGDLTQKAGTAGCVSETGTAGACQDGVALDGANDVAVSPDGASVYVASFDSDAVAIFDRDPTTGALTQKAGTAGCVSETGTGGCVPDGAALDGASGVAVSSRRRLGLRRLGFSDAVAIFDRDPRPAR